MAHNGTGGFALGEVCDIRGFTERRFRMKRPFYILAAVILIAVTSGFFRWHSLARVSAGMPSLKELHRAADVNRLRAEDFEDRSLVFPREVKP
jgi:hypothetical protein